MAQNSHKNSDSLPNINEVFERCSIESDRLSKENDKNKVTMSIEGEEYKQTTRRKTHRLKQDDSKESYDNILILESTESLANKEGKNSSFRLLDKANNVGMNWTEIDEDDSIRRNELPKL